MNGFLETTQVLQVTGGFMNAATSSLKRVTEGFLKLVSVFKEASQDFLFHFSMTRQQKI
jgi:hypothetical protein